jgi:hypothetical protein
MHHAAPVNGLMQKFPGIPAKAHLDLPRFPLRVTFDPLPCKFPA